MEYERVIDDERGVVVTTVRGRIEICAALERMREVPTPIEDGSPWQRRVIDLSQAELDAEDEVLWHTLAGGLRHRSDESGTRAVAVVVPEALRDPLHSLAVHHFGDTQTRMAICSRLQEALAAIGVEDAASA